MQDARYKLEQKKGISLAHEWKELLNFPFLSFTGENYGNGSNEKSGKKLDLSMQMRWEVEWFSPLSLSM